MGNDSGWQENKCYTYSEKLGDDMLTVLDAYGAYPEGIDFVDYSEQSGEISLECMFYLPSHSK